MASDHPFQLLFETLGRVPAIHAESVNRPAFEMLSAILSVPLENSGRCILLRAPRAGHGKTHLLSRIQHQLGASSEFIPLHAAAGCRIDAASVTDDTLRRLVRQLPASGGLTVLDLVTRRLFAAALQPLVTSGEVPCQDRESALTALRSRPIETFDFHHPNAATANWARENFEVLGQRLSLELAQRADLPVADVAFWIELLFQFSASPLENPSRVRTLADSVRGGGMERLQALLGLLTLLMRVVLVADDLEGFSTDDNAALKLAAFLGALRQSVERLDVIISLNQDVWQSAFLPRLSDGLADRLSEVVVELGPLTDLEMVALLDSRVPGLGNRVFENIDRELAGTHARGLIRAAGMAWLKATGVDSAPVDLTTPEIAPAIIAEPSQTLAPQPPPPPAEPVVLQELRVPDSVPVSEFVAPVFEPTPEVGIPAFAYVSHAAPVVEETPPVWPSPEFTPAPSPASPEWLPSPPASPPFYPPADSTSQADIRASILEPPASSFATPDWQNTAANFATPSAQEPWVSPPAVQADSDSPFQMRTAPESTGSFPPDAFTPAGWSNVPPAEPAHHEAHQEFASAPLGMEQAPAFPASAPSIFTPPVQPSEVPPPPTAADADRVENLLRQFRDRYGRGSL